MHFTFKVGGQNLLVFWISWWEIMIVAMECPFASCDHDQNCLDSSKSHKQILLVELQEINPSVLLLPDAQYSNVTTLNPTMKVLVRITVHYLMYHSSVCHQLCSGSHFHRFVDILECSICVTHLKTDDGSAFKCWLVCWKGCVS